MLEFETGKKVRPHISIAPLVDCVLQLLIFFMLSSNFVIQPGIKITLPTAITAKPQEDEIILFINKDNEIYLDDKKIDIGYLKQALEGKLKNSKDKSVTLKADEKIDLGLAVKVMDIAKQAEAEGLVISTKIEENAKR
jgi:biopolymer transport protein ExbD